MKPLDKRRDFVRLRAEGRSYQAISEELHIGKATCTRWERDLKDQIEELKREELHELFTTYHMTKEARIRRLGDTLDKIEDALDQVDLTETDPAKLLDFKLKYTEALKNEYTGSEPAAKLGARATASDIVAALSDLLNRVRAGDATADQAAREAAVLGHLLKAYETVEIKAKLDELEAIVGGGQTWQTSSAS